MHLMHVYTEIQGHILCYLLRVPEKGTYLFSRQLPLRRCIMDWGHKIADFDILPYISFIIGFRALKCVKRYWETVCEESI